MGLASIIEVLAPGRSIVACAFCGATGIEPGAPKTVCSVCSGSRQLLVQHSNTLFTCVQCSATGHKPAARGRFTRQACPECRGAGCISQAGTTHVLNLRQRCQRCGGVGSEPAEFGYTKNQPCSACSGSGTAPPGGHIRILT